MVFVLHHHGTRKKREEVHAHRAILSARSRYFFDLFGKTGSKSHSLTTQRLVSCAICNDPRQTPRVTEYKESTGREVDMGDTSPEAFKIALRHIYTGALFCPATRFSHILDYR